MAEDKQEMPSDEIISATQAHTVCEGGGGPLLSIISQEASVDARGHTNTLGSRSDREQLDWLSHGVIASIFSSSNGLFSEPEPGSCLFNSGDRRAVSDEQRLGVDTQPELSPALTDWRLYINRTSTQAAKRMFKNIPGAQLSVRLAIRVLCLRH